MSTANNVELLIITIVLSVLILVLVGFVIEAMVVVNKIKKLVIKTESIIDSVESAAETLKHMSKAAHSRFPLVNFLYRLFNANQNK